jgi:hypothetical protein
MRKVFSNSSDVIHKFVERSQNEGRSANCYFEGDKIYSYGRHYLLGEFVNNGKEDAIVINDRGYSSTTGKHIGELRWGSNQYLQFFTSNINLDCVLSSLESNKRSLVNARKPELYIGPSLELFKKLNEYIDWSKNKVLKREEKYKKIKSLIRLFEGSVDIEEFQKKEKSRLLRLKKKQEKDAAIKVKKALEDFNNYKIDYIYARGGEDYLRLSQDKKEVETSQRVRVNVESAKVLYSLIKAGRDIKGAKIDNYTVISINGTLKIGCHNINMDSVKTVGEQILKG